MPLHKQQLHEALCRTVGFTIQWFMCTPLETGNAQEVSTVKLRFDFYQRIQNN